jgi:hypothetical protein
MAMQLWCVVFLVWQETRKERRLLGFDIGYVLERIHLVVCICPVETSVNWKPKSWH